MIYAILGLLLMALIYLPSLWVRWVMNKHSAEIEAMPGNGGELAKHLIERFGLEGYKVETTGPNQDHFDPSCSTVRLSEKNFSSKSITAIAIAAHEVGHAIQDHRGEKVSKLRDKYLPMASTLSKIGIAILWLIPILGAVVKSPAVVVVLIAISIVFQLIGVASYLFVLPEEWDASFNKAMPMLIEGEYIPEAHIEPARSVLKAAALTYFAGALANILNIARWITVFRR